MPSLSPRQRLQLTLLCAAQFMLVPEAQPELQPVLAAVGAHQ